MIQERAKLRRHVVVASAKAVATGFSTIEEILREDLVVVKRDGRRESFDRTKLATGLRRAIAKRPIDAEQINGLALSRRYDKLKANLIAKCQAEQLQMRLCCDSKMWMVSHGLGTQAFMRILWEYLNSWRN